MPIVMDVVNKRRPDADDLVRRLVPEYRFPMRVKPTDGTMQKNEEIGVITDPLEEEARKTAPVASASATYLDEDDGPPRRKGPEAIRGVDEPFPARLSRHRRRRQRSRLRRPEKGLHQSRTSGL